MDFNIPDGPPVAQATGSWFGTNDPPVAVAQATGSWFGTDDPPVAVAQATASSASSFDTDDPPVAPATPSSFDLGAKLAQRLREHTADRDRTKRLLDAETQQLQRLLKAAPKRPRETKNALQQKAKSLERDRTTRSLPLAQEKALIRQIDAAEKSIKQHGQVERHQQLVWKKKVEIEASREALRSINMTISEIETALSKVELGKKLGCIPSEVVTREHRCPVDKLNWAIGKNGANIKAIEETVGVQIDCDKLRAKFNVRGTQAGVDEAVLQLEIFTKAVDEEMNASSDVIAYILSRQSEVLNKIKDDNPNVVIDVLSKVTRIKMRGHPDRVQKAKDDIRGVQVVSQSRLLLGKEASLVVGNTGGTIHIMSEQHGVVVDLSRDGDKTILRIIGPSENVNAAMAEIGKLLLENEEIEESIVVDPLLKAELLNKSGANIKEFQRSLSSAVAADHQPEAGGVYLAFDRNALKEGPPKLLLKCSRRVMGRAKSLVTKKVDEFHSNLISIDVPEEMIPAIIGKGGATINDLRKEGKGAIVETDAKNKGIIKVHSSDATTRDTIRQKVEQIIAENQIGTVSIEKKSIGILLGEPGKDVRKMCGELGCTLNVNNNDTELVIKGTNEKIEQASEILRVFLTKNSVGELDIVSGEEPLLFVGGSDSIMHQVEAKHDVKASFRKDKRVLQVRGEADKVSAALDDMKQFLNGGDGVSVCKFNIDEKSRGVVIGKGGSNIAKLEDDFKGVRVYLPKDSDTISIRGPEDLVKECRTRLINMIATTRISENIDINVSQHGELSESDVIKQISRFTNAQITLNETFIKVRGFSDDVRDAKASIEEHLTGVYHSYVYLEASQFGRVKNAVTKDPSHFQHIHASTGADIILDSEAAIHIYGKKSDVKKAKASVIMDFLTFMLPRQLQTVKIHRSLFKSMGDPGRLSQIASETGASISLDRDTSSVLIRSGDPDDCDKAKELVNSMMEECQQLIAVMQFNKSDAWLLSVIVGKGGSSIKKLVKETECSIEIFKDEVTVVISADSQDVVQAGEKALENIIHHARKECIFIDLPESAMPAFIGRGGTGIKKLSADNDVQVERTKKRSSTIKITGKEDCVSSAQNAVLSWVEEWEASHVGITIDLEEHLIPLILGKGGETVRSIEKETGCKVDVNRKRSALTVRYGSDANREDAINKIQAIIDEEKAKFEDRAAAKAMLKQEHAAKLKPEQTTNLKQEQTGNGTAKATIAAETNSSSLTPEHPPKDIADVAGVKHRSAEFAKLPVGMASVTSVKDRSDESVKRPVGMAPVTSVKDRSNESVKHPVGMAPVTEKEEGFNPAIHGTEEGRQLYHWLVTGHVGDLITDMVYPVSA